MFDSSCIPTKAHQWKDNSDVVLKRPSLDSIFRRLSSLADYHAGVIFHFCLIVCILSKYFALLFVAVELRCNYMILNFIMFDLTVLTVLLAQFSLYVHTVGLKPHSYSYHYVWALQFLVNLHYQCVDLKP